MKHRSTYRRINLHAALIYLAILLLPFSAEPLFAENRNRGAEFPLVLPTIIATQQRQAVEPTAPAQPNSSINIYLYLPVVTALPVETQAASQNRAQSPATFSEPPQSLNIYIFLPTIAR